MQRWLENWFYCARYWTFFSFFTPAKSWFELLRLEMALFTLWLSSKAAVLNCWLLLACFRIFSNPGAGWKHSSRHSGNVAIVCHQQHWAWKRILKGNRLSYVLHPVTGATKLWQLSWSWGLLWSKTMPVSVRWHNGHMTCMCYHLSALHGSISWLCCLLQTYRAMALRSGTVRTVYVLVTQI